LRTVGTYCREKSHFDCQFIRFSKSEIIRLASLAKVLEFPAFTASRGTYRLRLNEPFQRYRAASHPECSQSRFAAVIARRKQTPSFANSPRRQFLRRRGHRRTLMCLGRARFVTFFCVREINYGRALARERSPATDAGFPIRRRRRRPIDDARQTFECGHSSALHQDGLTSGGAALKLIFLSSAFMATNRLASFDSAESGLRPLMSAPQQFLPNCKMQMTSMRIFGLIRSLSQKLSKRESLLIYLQSTAFSSARFTAGMSRLRFSLMAFRRGLRSSRNAPSFGAIHRVASGLSDGCVSPTQPGRPVWC
jgi:hypothetical protein